MHSTVLHPVLIRAHTGSLPAHGDCSASCSYGSLLSLLALMLVICRCQWTTETQPNCSSSPGEFGNAQCCQGVLPVVSLWAGWRRGFCWGRESSLLARRHPSGLFLAWQGCGAPGVVQTFHFVAAVFNMIGMAPLESTACTGGLWPQRNLAPTLDHL